MPLGAGRALDVGCGTGGFARALATCVENVDAIDRNEQALSIARERSSDVANVAFYNADLFEFVPTPRYDFISCIAAIHHMPFGAATEVMKSMLEPGGVLAILGLFRPSGLPEYAREALTVPVNVAMGAGFAARRVLRSRTVVKSGRGVVDAPVVDPTMTLDEIRREAAVHLPDAELRHHFFWRYSLVYRSGSGRQEPR